MGAIFVIISILILLINIAVGFFRGVTRSAVRLGTLVLAAFVAFFLADAFASVLAGILEPTVESLLAQGALTEFVQSNPEMPELVRALAKALAAPLLFLICYMLLKVITLIIYKIICRTCRIRKSYKLGLRFAGAGIGLAIGMIGLVVFSTPVLGYTEFAGLMVDKLAETGVEEDLGELKTYSDDLIKPISETPVANLAYYMLGDTLFDSLTTTEWNGEDLSLKQEMLTIFDVVGEASKLSDKPVEEYGKEQSAALRAMIDSIEASRILSYLGGNTMSSMATAWLNQQPCYGIEPPAMDDGNVQILFNGLMRVFSTTSPSLFGNDLRFFVDFFDLLVKHEMFAATSSGAENAFVDKMVAGEFMNEALALIRSNPRMEPLSKAISDVGMNVLVQELGLPEEYRENYESLMNDMSGALQGSVVDGEIDVEKLHAGLNEAFATEGVEIPESAAEVIATALTDVFTPEELGTLTVDQITDKLIERFAAADTIPVDQIPDDLISQLPQ